MVPRVGGLRKIEIYGALALGVLSGACFDFYDIQYLSYAIWVPTIPCAVSSSVPILSITGYYIFEPAAREGEWWSRRLLSMRRGDNNGKCVIPNSRSLLPQSLYCSRPERAPRARSSAADNRTAPASAFCCTYLRQVKMEGLSAQPTFVTDPSPSSDASFCAFREQIACFGDSITQHGHCAYGWVTALQEAYRRRADVLNRGYSGYSTRFAVSMLPHIFGPQRRYLFSTVFFGANDAADPSSKPVQHVPLSEYADNMAVIIAAARAVSRAVVVIAPPPVDEARWDNRTLARAQEYGEAARKAAADAASQPGSPVLFLSAYDLMTSAPAPYSGEAPAGPFNPASDPHWHAYLSDGLHLSPAGNQLLAQA